MKHWMLLPPSLSGRKLANFKGGVKVKKPVPSSQLKDAHALPWSRVMLLKGAKDPEERSRKMRCSCEAISVSAK
jgi:hypothetical protein